MSDERPPSSSPGNPSELQQLEAALAAGHLTPELFATLSAQLRAAAPAAPVAPPAAPKERTFSPRGTDEELPSLLDMFNQPPAAPVGPPPVVPPAPPAARPAPASPPQPSAADAAARQLIEERLAQIRQPPAPPTPVPVPTPRPAPTFYPEPPAPTFYPTSPVAEVASPPPAQPTPPRPAPPRPSAPPAKSAAGKTGGWVLLLLLGLALAGAVTYFFIQNSHPDEALTSPSLPTANAAPKEVAAPKSAKRTKKSAKKKRKTTRTPLSAAAPTATEAPADEPTTVAEEEPAAVVEAPAVTTQRSPPAAPEAGDDAATVKIRTVMAAYYADLFAPPLHASQYFAPQVERLYIQQNLTPAAIDAELARSFFPENQQAIARIEPGSLRVSEPAADGSRTATFTETMRLYRVSLKKRQQLRTQVRVRFNADNKIVFMRQEKLLANTFE